MKKLLVSAFFAAAALTAHAQQKVEQLDSVMIDTKVSIPRKNSGKVVTTIDNEMILRNQGKSVAQLINEVSGIEINGSRSNDGQNLGYYVRGGRNRQVLIVIDGVPVNDPSQIANDYDLRLVPTETIERIEIMKGASSVLYGANAGTAVISISTLKASKEKISAIITSSVGTNRSSEDDDLDTDYSVEEFNNAVAVSGTLGKWFYNANFSNRYVEGLSAVAAPEDATEAFEADDFNQFEGRVNLGFNFSKNVSLSQFFSFGKLKADFDSFNYTDAANRNITDQLRTGGQFTWKYKKGIYVFNDNFTWIEREIESDFPVRYDTRSYNLDNYLTYEFTDSFTALVGLGHNNSSFKSFSVPFGETELVKDLDDSVAEFTMFDPYVNLTYISKMGFQATAGARMNIHSEYGSHLVYNVNPSYNFGFGKNNLKLLASYSTAYITPSLFQLHDPLYGNLELEPEENTTIEGGLEFTTENNIRLSALYFTRDEKNFVDFVTVDPDNFISQYQNIDEEFTASGVEVEVAAPLGNRFMFTGNYTNTQADEKFALRIPEHKANASLSYNVANKSFITASYQFTGERTDSFFNNETFESENVILDSFGTLNLTASTQLLPNMKVFVNVSNILNEEYEEIYRFQTLGRNVRVGFNLKL
ncbi:outer membrane protein [Patiriisocius marinistellae]|uniref:Outer membrane protein n=1 Tax=Patiriisocius marinistellae TaxID=2494560 RepID=A0A5J4G0G9_9FLAO|nr:TonB-dependent receptor plug domain-containing protein [Patiriisocius marinistellae]GEQ85979.1 outer membrane protein [Patiriisocius marinistellae]